MNKFLGIIAVTLLLFTSCKTREKVLYFQDVEGTETVQVQKIEAMKYLPGDKLSVVVTSSSTPTLAAQFNLPIVTTQAGTSINASNQIAVYTVDENGCIDMPTIGSVKVLGLTRAQAAKHIQNILREGQLRDAVVTVESSAKYITVLGDVLTPGRLYVDRDNLTLLEAIGQAGDLNMTARRDRIMVIRQEGGEAKTYYADIRSKDIMNSPVYNLRQNDIIYVEPNKVKVGQSTNNDNSVRSISTWLSVSSVLISLGILVFR